MSSVNDRESELLAAQAWRTETPGNAGWERTVRPDDANKYYVISADCHAIEPRDWMTGYIDDDVRDQLRERRSLVYRLRYTQAVDVAAAIQEFLRAEQQRTQQVSGGASSCLEDALVGLGSMFTS